MAVDKNFVIKNGIEVNSNLIFADANTKSVGIGSTGPRFTLDVRGGIAATDGNFSGILTAQNVNIANYGILNGTGANLSGIATFTGGISANQLSVSGLSTLTHLESTNVKASGITTLTTADITTLSNYPNFTGGLSVVGVATASSFTGNLTGNVVGNVTGNVTGELAGAAVTTGAYGAHVSGVLTATSFIGDGSGLTNTISGVGINSGGTNIGYGVTTLNFVGTGTTVEVSGTTANITPGGGTGSGSITMAIGVRVGTAVTFSFSGSSFNISNRSGGNTVINI